MKPDCCPEPVPGPLVTDLVLATVWTAMGGLARGGWPGRGSLAPADRTTTLQALDEVVSGLYLAVDTDQALRYLGQARRDGGVGARVREHLRHPERARVYAGIYVIEADEFEHPDALDAAEGKAADDLRLRRRMGQRTWPARTDWLQQVGARPYRLA